MLPGRLPRRGRDRGNTARARPPPADAPHATQPRSTPCRSRRRTFAGLRFGGLRAGREIADGPDLERTVLVLAKVTRRLDGFVEVLAIDQVEAQKLLLGLGERAVDDKSFAAVAHGGGGGGRHQARDGPELA